MLVWTSAEGEDWPHVWSRLVVVVLVFVLIPSIGAATGNSEDPARAEGIEASLVKIFRQARTLTPSGTMAARRETMQNLLLLYSKGYIAYELASYVGLPIESGCKNLEKADFWLRPYGRLKYVYAYEVHRVNSGDSSWRLDVYHGSDRSDDKWRLGVFFLWEHDQWRINGFEIGGIVGSVHDSPPIEQFEE